jgi:hypothetical protein
MSRQHTRTAPDARAILCDRVRVLEAELRAVHDRIVVLEQQIAASRPTGPVTDAALLAAIFASVAGRVFTAKELLDHGQVDPDLAHVLAGFTGRRLGRRLRDIVRTGAEGWRLECCGRDNTGCIWRVYLAPESRWP